MVTDVPKAFLSKGTGVASTPVNDFSKNVDEDEEMSVGYYLGFYLYREPDGTWAGSVPGLGDPEVQRQVEERRRLARERVAAQPSLWVSFMDLLRSGLDAPRNR